MFTSLFVSSSIDYAIPQVSIVQNQSATNQQIEMVLDDECQTVQTPDNPSEYEVKKVRPASLIAFHFKKTTGKAIDVSKAVVTVLSAPKFGTLNALLIEQGARGLSGPKFSYIPKPNYLGPDSATFSVEAQGKRYVIHQKYYVVIKTNDNDWYEKGTPATLCAQSKYKRISSFTHGEPTLISQWDTILQSLAASYGQFSLNEYLAAASGVTLTFGALNRNELGETIGAGTTMR